MTATYKFFLFFVLLASCGCSSDFLAEPKCIETSMVASVDSIFYRGGFVTLENGDKINVGQPMGEITVGSSICVNWLFKGKESRRQK